MYHCLMHLVHDDTVIFCAATVLLTLVVLLFFAAIMWLVEKLSLLSVEEAKSSPIEADKDYLLRTYGRAMDMIYHWEPSTDPTDLKNALVVALDTMGKEIWGEDYESLL